MMKILNVSNHLYNNISQLIIVIAFFWGGGNILCAQYIGDSLNIVDSNYNPYKSKVKSKLNERIEEKIDSTKVFIPRSPEKAGLYAAVLPGLGQLYNKKYLKSAFYLGMLGTSIGFTRWYQNLYKEYRSAYLQKLSDENYLYRGRDISAETLALNMNKQKRYRDYGIAACVLIYAIQIVDAIVDAHLDPVRKDPSLKIKPVIIEDDIDDSFGMTMKAGIGLTYRF